MAYTKGLGLSALSLGVVLSYGCAHGAPSSVDIASGAAGASVDDEGGTPVVQEPEPVHDDGSAGSASSHGHSRPPAADPAGGAPNDEPSSRDDAGSGAGHSEPAGSPDTDDAGAAGARTDDSSGGTSSGSGAATGGGSGMGTGGTANGGSSANAGSSANGGTANGGSSANAGSSANGGTANGGSSDNGGTSSGGAGASNGGGAGAAAGSGGGSDCSFSVSYGLSGAMPTVAIVDWATTLAGVSTAKIVYTLATSASETLNAGGVAPVYGGDGAHHDWLVGLKPSRDYTFYVEVGAASGATCKSETFSFTTGPLPNAPALSRAVSNRSAVSNGFIVTSGGFGSSAPAFIFDADGDVVWAAPAPKDCSRVRLDYAAKNVWMLSANASNAGGDVRYVSLDGATSAQSLPGFERAHHDLTALPDGGVAALAWSASGLDPESDLVERRPDGSTTVLFHVGSNLYAGGPSAFGGGKISYHANSVAYHPSDTSFTIGDRNPSSFVKVSSTGAPLWQFGGSCANAKAARCAAGTWNINHGHQLLDDGTFLFFNNTGMGKTTPSSAYAFKLDAASALNVSQLEQWPGKSAEHSDTLGDVQRLPNGNTLVTFSNNGVIYELDPSWNVVQTWRADAFGYSEWRPTLYGPPVR